MTTTQPSPAAVQAAIASVPVRMVAAWAAKDADAFAELFIDEGYMILPGVHAAGKENIRAFMTEAFQGEYAGSQVTGSPIGLTFMTPGAAILVTKGGVMYDRDSAPTHENAIRASWIVTERDGVWKLAGYHNCPANRT